MKISKTSVKELTRKEYESLAAASYGGASSALRAVHAALDAIHRSPTASAGSAWYESDRSKPLMRRPDGSIAIPGFAHLPDGRKEPFAAIARPKADSWEIASALVPGRTGEPAMTVTDGHGIDWSQALEAKPTAQQDEARRATEALSNAKSAVSEASRLGANPGDDILNQIHSASIKTEALKRDADANRGGDMIASASAKTKVPTQRKTGLASAIKSADPNAIVESRGGKLLRITVATTAIAEAINPTAVATSESAKLLKLASGAARLPNGNRVMGAATALEGLAAGLDRRLPAHDVHLSIDALEQAIQKIGARHGQDHPALAVAGALSESRRNQIEATMRAMVPGKSGLGL